MADTVLDTSVLAAAIRGELRTEDLLPILEGAVMSVVNWCELYTKLHDFGMVETLKAHAVTALLDRVEPFSPTQARLAADLRPHTRKAGLSLGEHACIALGIHLNADVYTADRAWTTLGLPCRIHLIR